MKPTTHNVALALIRKYALEPEEAERISLIYQEEIQFGYLNTDVSAEEIADMIGNEHEFEVKPQEDAPDMPLEDALSIIQESGNRISLDDINESEDEEVEDTEEE